MSTNQLLAPLPTTHAELQARLEKAGVPRDQITAVLLDKAYSTPPLPYPATPPPPPPPQPLARVPTPPHAIAAELPAEDGASLSQISSISTPNLPLVYTMTFISGDADGLTTHAIHAEGRSKLQPTWSCIVSTKLGNRHPHLRVFRDAETNGRPLTSREEIGRAHFQGANINHWHPWMPSWSDAWNPEDRAWFSDTGLLGGIELMKWEYGQEDAYQQTAIRCVTTGKAFSERVRSYVPSQRPPGTEVCKAVNLLDGSNSARIVLPASEFGAATRRQLDEMVAHAVVQLWRHGLGCRGKGLELTTSRSSDKLVVATEAIKL